MPEKRNKNEREVSISNKRKGIKVQKVKLPTSTWVIDVLIGDEEQNGKQKKKKQGADPQPIYPGPFGYLLQPTGIIQWTYLEATTHRDIYIFIVLSLPPVTAGSARIMPRNELQ